MPPVTLPPRESVRVLCEHYLAVRPSYPTWRGEVKGNPPGAFRANEAASLYRRGSFAELERAFSLLRPQYPHLSRYAWNWWVAAFDPAAPFKRPADAKFQSKADLSLNELTRLMNDLTGGGIRVPKELDE